MSENGSKARKNGIDVLIAIQDWVNIHRRGFKISEIQEHCTAVSDRTVRRVITELCEEDLVFKEDGYYYPVVSLQETWFADSF